MKNITKSITLIVIGAAILIYYSVVPNLVNIQETNFLFAFANLIVIGGYFAIGMGSMGIIKEYRRKRKYQKEA